MYHKNDISIDNCNIDSREDDRYHNHKFRNKPTIMLPHSCGDWVIGGVEEAEQMIADLKSAIENLKSNN